MGKTSCDVETSSQIECVICVLVLLVKVPVTKVGHGKRNFNVDLQVPVSPTGNGSLEEQVLALRARNKVLTDALAAVNESATKEFKKNYDLVWYARNHCKFFFL